MSEKNKVALNIIREERFCFT